MVLYFYIFVYGSDKSELAVEAFQQHLDCVKPNQ